MSELRSAAQEAAEDLFFGQSVIIWARWFVIIAGIVVVLWSTSDVGSLTAAVLMVVPLIAINFFVYARYLMEKPINRLLLLGLSAVDLLIVSLIVLFLGNANGFNSPYYIFYYPLLLAVAFVFPMRVTVGYTALALILYVAACFARGPAAPYYVAGWTSENFETLFVRVITMATMGVLGTLYWRTQRERRRKSAGALDVSPAGL